MVREGGANSSEPIGTDHPVSQLQIGLKSLLNLEFQIDAVDYRRTNFVHADLDPAAFEKLQRERGETILGLMLRAVFEEQARQTAGQGNVLDGFQLLAALLSPNRAHALKLLLGRQMADLEDVVAGIDRSADGKGSVLLSARNEHAVRVLVEQIGRGRRSLGVFYGAGHMPDLKTRLEALGFRETQSEWLTAWNIRQRRR
jgi:hypothetical protein